ncbi:MAG: oligopeptide transporter, OPT family [Myxococcota bacterium]|nr:oligopeptide transporter, OPT family [Myxococcota bacterium]
MDPVTTRPGDMPPEIKPYVPAESSPPDFTLRASVLGIVFGILFGMANAYLGLRVGLTVSTAIPLAVIAVASLGVLGKFGRKASVLECNITQTTGSASSSVASGAIFTLPALFMWGLDPALGQMALLSLCGGTLGVLFMIPLRRYLIVKEHHVLPYPEGTAAAQVLIAADQARGGARKVFVGLGIGAAYQLIVGFLKVWPRDVFLRVPLLPKTEIGLVATPALLSVGYIIGFRLAAIMFAGGLVSWLGLIPLIAYFGQHVGEPLSPATGGLISAMSADDIWKNYVRYIGAGAVAFGGIATVVRVMPMIATSLRGSLRGLAAARGGADAGPRTDRDLPMKLILAGVCAVVLLIGLTPFVLGTAGGMPLRFVAAVCIAVFAFVFVAVSARIVGLIGVSSNPTSAMAIVTLLFTAGAFYLLGWTDATGKAMVLIVGTVVCTAASIAGDISQDLKSGYILGATPWKQQTAEIVGVTASAFFVVLVISLLAETYGFPSKELPAPQATLMKTVIEGVLAADLPWELVLTGAAFALVAMLCGIPPLPFAVGLYLPVTTMAAVFVGGVVRYFVEERFRGGAEARQTRKENGILFGSGLIAGEGVMGVLIAGYAVVTASRPEGLGIEWLKFAPMTIGGETWAVDVGGIASLCGFAFIVALLVRAARGGKTA